jgi:hypothetical protein
VVHAALQRRMGREEESASAVNEEAVIKEIMSAMKRKTYGEGAENASNDLADCSWQEIEDALRTLAQRFKAR